MIGLWVLPPIESLPYRRPHGDGATARRRLMICSTASKYSSSGRGADLIISAKSVAVNFVARSFDDFPAAVIRRFIESLYESVAIYDSKIGSKIGPDR